MHIIRSRDRARLHALKTIHYKSPVALCLAAGWAVLFVVCPVAAPVAGQTFGTQRLFGRYQQFTWTDQHGLPQNGISTVTQTPDGYLWLATAEGIVRFDGVRFTAFDTANTPELKSNNVASASRTFKTLTARSQPISVRLAALHRATTPSHSPRPMAAA